MFLSKLNANNKVEGTGFRPPEIILPSVELNWEKNRRCRRFFTRVCKRGKELRSRRKWRLYRELSSGHLGDPSEDDEENKNPGAFIIQGYCTAPFWSPKKKKPPINPNPPTLWSCQPGEKSVHGRELGCVHNPSLLPWGQCSSINTNALCHTVSLSLSGRAGTERYRGIYTPPTHTTPNLREKKKDEFLFFPIEIYPLWKFSYTHNGLWWKDNDLKKKKKNEIRIEEQQTPEVRWGR